jgi:uncharacterized membrane protein
MDYLIVKWLHIVSSTFLFGTGVGSAFYLFFVTLHRDVRAIAVVTRYVVIADWLFTATTAILQPVTGFYLLHIMGIPMSTHWVAVSLVLYVIAIGCWLPVVRIQMRLRDLSQLAYRAGVPLPAAYWKAFRWWVALGVPALFAFLAIFWLMVAKPA